MNQSIEQSPIYEGPLTRAVAEVVADITARSNRGVPPSAEQAKDLFDVLRAGKTPEQVAMINAEEQRLQEAGKIGQSWSRIK